jgi:rhodanese-related sulfurtransferase
LLPFEEAFKEVNKSTTSGNVCFSAKYAKGIVMSQETAKPYAGDLSAREAWEALNQSKSAVLVDVRSKAEWAFVGVPVLSPIGKQTLLVEWNDFSTGTVVPDFVGRLNAALAESGAADDAPLYFICRSGNRSRNAAIAATAAGHPTCFNIELGFEGLLDSERHRNTPGSWKAEGLPWEQS